MINAPPADIATGVSLGINVGTRGLKMNNGYDFNNYMRKSLRGACLYLNNENHWMQTEKNVKTSSKLLMPSSSIPTFSSV